MIDEQIALKKTASDLAEGILLMVNFIWGGTIMFSPFVLREEGGIEFFLAMVASIPFYVYFINKYVSTKK